MGPGHDITIRRGATFRKPFLFRQPDLLFKQVTDFRNTSPIEMVCASHGMPDDWPYWLEKVTGDKTLERARPGTPRISRVLDPDTIAIPSTDGFGAASTSATICYYPPADLLGVTARMTFWGPDDALLAEYTNGMGLEVDEKGRITVDLSAAVTGEFTWENATYELDVTFIDSTVIHYDMGSVMVVGRAL